VNTDDTSIALAKFVNVVDKRGVRGRAEQ
jgi:hypothetical protein